MQKQVNVEMQVQVHVQVPGKDKTYSLFAALCSRIYGDLMKNTSHILKLPKYTFNNSETNKAKAISAELFQLNLTVLLCNSVIV